MLFWLLLSVNFLFSYCLKIGGEQMAFHNLYNILLVLNLVWSLNFYLPFSFSFLFFFSFFLLFLFLFRVFVSMVWCFSFVCTQIYYVCGIWKFHWFWFCSSIVFKYSTESVCQTNGCNHKFVRLKEINFSPSLFDSCFFFQNWLFIPACALFFFSLPRCCEKTNRSIEH